MNYVTFLLLIPLKYFESVKSKKSEQYCCYYEENKSVIVIISKCKITMIIFDKRKKNLVDYPVKMCVDVTVCRCECFPLIIDI